MFISKFFSSKRRIYEVLIWETCPFLGKIHASLYFVISLVIVGFFVHSAPRLSLSHFYYCLHFNSIYIPGDC